MNLISWISAITIYVLFPFFIYLFLKKITNLNKLGKGLWLLSFITALVIAPLFLFRKYWELIMFNFCSNFWFILTAIQFNNAFWEELAKLSVLLFFIWLFKDKIKKFFANRKDSLALGYWIGLGYGIGEAITFTLMISYPNLGYILHYNIGLLFYLDWFFFYGKFWTVQGHGILGAIIGYGLYCFWTHQSKKKLILFFFTAVFYHMFINGFIQLIIKHYSQMVIFSLPTLWYMITPILFISIGYLIIWIISSLEKGNLIARM